jgi:signal transduction histidine kinase
LGQENLESGALQSVSTVNWRLGKRRVTADRDAHDVVGANGGRAVTGATPPRLARAAAAQLRVPLALLLGGSAAVAIVVTFHLGSVWAPGPRAALETMMTLFALAAAWLLRAQFSFSGRLRDLLLLAAVLVLGLTNFWASALPAALDAGTGTYFSSAELWGQLVVGGILAAAALTPRNRLVVRQARSVAITAGFGFCAASIAGLGGLLTARHGKAATSSLAHAMARPLLAVVVLGVTLPLGYAAVAFARRGREEADPAARLLVFAALLLGGATLSELMTRSLAPGRIGVDVGLRILACSMTLAAAVVLERRVHRSLAKSAALAERRRVARDLHDGLAQDLALIVAHGPSIAAEIGDDHPVVVAARRALAISRTTISDLTDPAGASAHESLEAMAQELRDRFEMKIAVDTQLQRDLQPHERENVTRIAREAIANAARHGRARNVVVSLRHGERGIALRVVDDGCGIEHADNDSVHDGFGLRSMRERAASLGGYLSVMPSQRGGTELEVVLP